MAPGLLGKLLRQQQRELNSAEKAFEEYKTQIAKVHSPPQAAIHDADISCIARSADEMFMEQHKRVAASQFATSTPSVDLSCASSSSSPGSMLKSPQKGVQPISCCPTQPTVTQQFHHNQPHNGGLGAKYAACRMLASLFSTEASFDVHDPTGNSFIEHVTPASQPASGRWVWMATQTVEDQVESTANTRSVRSSLDCSGGELEGGEQMTTAKHLKDDTLALTALDCVTPFKSKRQLPSGNPFHQRVPFPVPLQGSSDALGVVPESGSMSTGSCAGRLAHKRVANLNGESDTQGKRRWSAPETSENELEYVANLREMERRRREQERHERERQRELQNQRQALLFQQSASSQAFANVEPTQPASTKSYTSGSSEVAMPYIQVSIDECESPEPHVESNKVASAIQEAEVMKFVGLMENDAEDLDCLCRNDDGCGAELRAQMRSNAEPNYPSTTVSQPAGPQSCQHLDSPMKASIITNDLGDAQASVKATLLPETPDDELSQALRDVLRLLDARQPQEACNAEQLALIREIVHRTSSSASSSSDGTVTTTPTTSPPTFIVKGHRRSSVPVPPPRSLLPNSAFRTLRQLPLHTVDAATDPDDCAASPPEMAEATVQTLSLPVSKAALPPVLTDALFSLGSLKDAQEALVAHVTPLLGLSSCCTFTLVSSRLQKVDGTSYPLVGIVGMVASSGELLQVTDSTVHPSYDSSVDIATSIYSCLPLTLKGSTMGVLCVARSYGQFDEDELLLLQQVAAWLAVYIHHHQLEATVQHQRQQTAHVKHLAALLGTVQPDLPSVVTIILHGFHAMVNASQVALLLKDANEDHFEVYGPMGPTGVHATGQGLAGTAASSGKPVYVVNPSTDSRFQAALEGFLDPPKTSVLYFPLPHDGVVVAVLRLADKLGPNGSIQPLQPEDEAFVAAAADLVGAAIHRALIHQPAVSPPLHSRFLRRIRQMVTAWPNEETLALQAVAAALEITGAEEGTLYVLGSDATTFTCYRSDGTVADVPFGAGIVSYVASQGISASMPMGKAVANFGGTCHSASKFLLCVPVTNADGEVCGVLELINKKCSHSSGPSLPFTAEDEACLMHITSYAAVLLHHCRQHQFLCNLKDRQKVVADLLGRLTTSDLTSIHQALDIVRAGAQQLADADSCVIFMRDLATEELVSLRPPMTVPPREQRFPPGLERVPMAKGGIAAQAVMTGQTINVHRNANDRTCDRLELPSNMRAGLCIPLHHRSEVIGVMQLLRNSHGAFSRDDQQILEWFAEYAAVALFNTLQYQHIFEAHGEAVSLLHLLLSSMNATSGIGEVQMCLRNIPCTLTPLVPVNGRLLRTCSTAQLSETQLAAVVTIDFDILHPLDAEHHQEGVQAIALLTKIFDDLGIIEHFNIPLHILHKFLLHVMCAYRHLYFHNFLRAVDAAQLMYVLLQIINADQTFDQLEVLILLLGCLLHGVDHPGLNNDYHIRAETPVDIINGTQGSLQIHHCVKAIQVLNAEGAKIFDYLDAGDVSDAYPLLVSVIMATDTSHPLAPLGQKAVQKSNLLAMQHLIRVATMSTLVRSFDVAHRWAQALTKEFLCRGPIESAKECNLTGDAEEVQEIARSQIWYLDNVAVHEFQALVEWDSSLHFVLRQLQNNRAHWVKIIANK